MSGRSHVIIATTGATGSTLLMEILTGLGLDTGFKLEEGPATRMECRIRGRDAKPPFPYIIKEAKICRDLPERIKRWGWTIDHVYALSRTPMILASAEDRLSRVRCGVKPPKYTDIEDRDTLVEVRRKVSTYNVRIEKKFLSLIAHLSSSDIPHTLISYPDYADDSEFCYKKLSFLMQKFNITYEQFKSVFDRLVNETLVEEAKNWKPWKFTDRQREVWNTIDVKDQDMRDMIELHDLRHY